MTASDAPWIDYEWVTLRVVPRVHTEQFACVGVLLHARQAAILEARIAADWAARVEAIAPSLDLERLERHLETYRAICAGDEAAGPVALLPPSERFHWLTHPRSGILQTSPRHPGRTRDPARTLDTLLDEQC